MTDIGGSASIDPILSPDPVQMLAHVTHLFGHVSHGMIELTWSNATTGALSDSHWFNTGELQELVDKACELNRVQGQNVYIGAALRKDDLAFGRASDADYLMSTAFYVDLDDPGVVENAFPLLQHCKPTIAVVTGERPHKRAQLWWRLEEPVSDPSQHMARCKALAAHFGGDPAVFNPGRVMRLGGSVAWPRKSGRVLEMTQVLEFVDRPLSMMPGQMENAYPYVAQKMLQISDPERSLISGKLNTSRLMEGVTSGAEWHRKMVKLTANMVSRGFSDDEMLAMAEHFTLPGYTHDQTRQEMAKAIQGARLKWNVPNPIIEAAEPIKDDPSADFVTYEVDDDFCSYVPPRQWLYGTKLIRQFCTLLVSPGGVGKTAFTVGLAIACQTGKQILADKPHKPMNVWGFYLEEPKEEIQRRMKAAKMVYKREMTDPEPGKLLVSSGRDQQLIVAQSIGKDEFIMTPNVERLENQIRRQGTDVLIIDPFVKTHTIEENNNVLIEKVVTLFNEIAGRTGCAIFLVHHTRKGAQAGDADSSRGASSIVGNMRAAFTLAAMTTEDAKELGVSPDEKRFLIRLDDAKANMAPKSDKAEWIKLLSQNLGNATEEYPSGDNVQVVSSWLPPDLWEGVSVHTANLILDTIAGGQPQEDGSIEYYTDAKSSKSRWAGVPIMRILAENGQERTEGQAQQIINRWMKSDPPILEISDYLSGKGKEKRRCLIVNNANRPGPR